MLYVLGGDLAIEMSDATYELPLIQISTDTSTSLYLNNTFEILPASIVLSDAEMMKAIANLIQALSQENDKLSLLVVYDSRSRYSKVRSAMTYSLWRTVHLAIS